MLFSLIHLTQNTRKMSTIVHSTLNPYAPIFIPQNHRNIVISHQLTDRDAKLVALLDVSTQISIDALWNEYVQESIENSRDQKKQKT